MKTSQKNFGFVNNMASEIELIKKCRNSPLLETGCCLLMFSYHSSYIYQVSCNSEDVTFFVELIWNDPMGYEKINRSCNFKHSIYISDCTQCMTCIFPTK